LGPVSVLLTQTLILLTVLYGLHQRRRGSAVWILVGVALAGLSIETITSWLIIGVTTGILLTILYRLVLRHEPQVLMITTAAMVCSECSKPPFPHPWQAQPSLQSPRGFGFAVL